MRHQSPISKTQAQSPNAFFATYLAKTTLTNVKFQMTNDKIRHASNPEVQPMKTALVLILALVVVVYSTIPTRAQDPATQQPTAEELAKQKAELEKNAYRLLDQVIDEAQSLRLPENRVRLQINAADLLWNHNQERARSLFSQASDGVAEMIRNTSTTQPQGNQRAVQQQYDRRSFALRQDLVLAAAKHDAALAYQLLAATKSQTPTPNQPVDPRNPRQQV